MRGISKLAILAEMVGIEGAEILHAKKSLIKCANLAGQRVGLKMKEKVLGRKSREVC
jgi:hypothetical protein